MENLCIHTITTKPWNLEEAVVKFSEAGVKGISVWEDSTLKLGAEKSGRLIREHGLEIVSYVRGGFFPSINVAKREQAIKKNKKMMEDAAALGAPSLVLVCGAEPMQSLENSRMQIQAGIEALLPLAEKLNVKLSIEPLHPMYADTRSAINTLKQANDIAEAINSPYVGVAVDVYHLWWDDNLENEIKRCGENGNLFAFHICDWSVPTVDMLNDRGLMGEGCIPLSNIKKWVVDAGFSGYHEVEIFSNKFWQMDQDIFLKKIIEAYKDYQIQ
ncbi:sugar phosphate isomerase/epimerase family protein [Chondrinema litorale]|uniref:sugar phosphate isomerase/epimerase family protein n=1 Tax=Chondrinema litorale TaxID=2994555 RepID=UPI002542F74F|nr:sugar phosphate isomerase/epimerase family protein [Chondrinema litorale]UZR98743.1 sugar phosphate isomerase/epimerase [Chondrinema litorale]